MILVAIGANLEGVDGSPSLQTCQRAAAALNRLPGLRLIGLSRWFETIPDPPSAQPNYVNGVAALIGNSNPAALLSWLQRIEADAGRRRGAVNAARTLDLDIIAMGANGGLCRDAPDPIVPHPRAHLRAFVMSPLVDVAPNWVHPRLGLTASALLDRLDQSGVRPASHA